MLKESSSHNTVYCFDLPREKLDAIQEHLKKAGLSAEFRDWSRDKKFVEAENELVLVLFNAHILCENTDALNTLSKQLPVDVRAIGLYSSTAPSTAVFVHTILLRDLVSIHAPEHIAFAINRELDTLALERKLLKRNALLANGDRRISFLKDSDLSLDDNHTGTSKRVLNRHDFLKYLDEHLYDLNQNHRAALALIEIDHYSSVPKEREREFNSRYMSFVLNIILSRCQSSDILAYLDSNLFALFSTRHSNKSFPNFAEHLRLSVTENLFQEQADFFQIKCSIGVCFWSEHIANTKELVARAQQACTTASIGDGNQVHIYQTVATPFDVLEGLPEYKEEIKSALREDRFRLVYQPIVNLKLVGEENYAILIRMIDKTGKNLSPDRFIPVAENTGLIDYIDQWVIQQSIELAKRSQKLKKSRSYFLKISGYSLNNDKIIKCLYYYLKKAKVNGHALVFQIDYVEFVNHPEQVITFMEKLTKVGCRIAFDHFGFGEYSVDRLKDLPIDFIKIDGSFMRNMQHHPSHLKTIENIQLMAAKCDIKTIAKSVENADVLATLWNIGVNSVQGYFIQEPNETMHFDFSG